jgi:exopolysaccharide biosynthesis polyprenyl glycosylphosphotransferase
LKASMPERQLQLDPQAEDVDREATLTPVRPRPRLRPVRLRRPLARAPARARRAQEGIIEGQLSDATYRRDAAYRRALALADLASATIAVAIGVSVLGEDALNPLALLALPLVLAVGKVTGIYDRDEHLLRKTTLDEVPTLFWVATLYTLLIWLGGELIVDGNFGRDQAVGVWALLFASMLATRALARYVARSVSEEERCLVLGDADTSGWIARRLDEAPGLNAQVIGRVPLEPELPGSNGIPVLGGVEALRPVLKEQGVERAIIVPRGAVSDDLLNTIRRLKSLGVRVSVLPRLFEVVGASVERDEVDGITLLGMRRYGLSRSSGVIKRALDLAGAGFGVLVLAPLLAVIAIAIKLDSPGPVFFRQWRMGRNDVPFEMLKFRTMVDRAESMRSALAARNEAEDGLFKIKDDPRITRVGGLLRRTSLDELPQLFNVLRGDMALVGPRPLVLDEDCRIEGWQRSRLQLPPGMTGPWQVFGSARIPLGEMVKIDYLYGANWSLWLDVKILLRTVAFVFERRGL